MVSIEEIRFVIDGRSAKIGADQIAQALELIEQQSRQTDLAVRNLGAAITLTGRGAATDARGLTTVRDLSRATEQSVEDLARAMTSAGAATRSATAGIESAVAAATSQNRRLGASTVASREQVNALGRAIEQTGQRTRQSVGAFRDAATGTQNLRLSTRNLAIAMDLAGDRINQTGNRARRLADAATAGSRDARRLGTSWQQASGSIERGGRAIGAVERQVRRLAAFFSAGLIARGLVSLSDSYDALQNRLRLVTDGTADLIEKQTALGNISQETRSNIRLNADLYNRLFRATRQLGTGSEDLLLVTSTLNKAIKLSGATAQEANSGLIQLAQGLAAGALRGDELRSVLEQIPIVADAIQERLGVTRGELRALGEDGKLTSDIIIDSVLQIAPRIEEEFDKLTPLIGDSLASIASQVSRVLGNATVGGVSFASFLDSIAESLDRLATAQEQLEGSRARDRELNSVEAFVAREREAAKLLGEIEAQESSIERRRKAEEERRKREAEEFKRIQEEIGELAAEEVKDRKEAARLIQQNLNQLQSLQRLIERNNIDPGTVIIGDEPGTVTGPNAGPPVQAIDAARPGRAALDFFDDPDQTETVFFPRDTRQNNIRLSDDVDPVFGPVASFQALDERTRGGQLFRAGFEAAGFEGFATVGQLQRGVDAAIAEIQERLESVKVETDLFVEDAAVDFQLSEQGREAIESQFRKFFDAPFEFATEATVGLSADQIEGIGTALDGLATRVDNVQLQEVLKGSADQARTIAETISSISGSEVLGRVAGLFDALKEKSEETARAERKRIADNQRATENAERFVRQLELQIALLGEQDEGQQQVERSLGRLFELTKDGEGVYESFRERVKGLVADFVDLSDKTANAAIDEQGAERLNNFIEGLEQEVEVLRFSNDLQRELAQARLDAGIALGLSNDELIQAIRGEEVENEVLREKIDLIQSLVTQRRQFGARSSDDDGRGTESEGLVEDADQLGRDIAGAVTSRLDNVLLEAETLRDALKAIWKDIANDLLQAFILDPIKDQFAQLVGSIFQNSPANDDDFIGPRLAGSGANAGPSLFSLFGQRGSPGSGGGFGGLGSTGGGVGPDQPSFIGPPAPPLAGPPAPPIGGGGASFFQETGVLQDLSADPSFIGPPASAAQVPAAAGAFNPLLFSLGSIVGVLLSQLFGAARGGVVRSGGSRTGFSALPSGPAAPSLSRVVGAGDGGFLIGSGQQGFASLPGFAGPQVQMFARGGSTVPTGFVDSPTMFPLGDGFGVVGERPSSVGEVIMPAFRTQQGDIGVRVEGLENVSGPTTITNQYVFPSITDHAEFRRSQRALNDDHRRSLNRR